MAIRLAYQNREPAHFLSICGFLRKGATRAQTERIDTLHAAWRGAVEGPSGFDYILNGEQFTDGQIFHLWLYGVAFHQDAEKKKKYQMLDQAGAFAALGVQGTALQLAGRILDLDDLIAEILHEEPVERIEAPELPKQGAAASETLAQARFFLSGAEEALATSRSDLRRMGGDLTDGHRNQHRQSPQRAFHRPPPRRSVTPNPIRPSG